MIQILRNNFWRTVTITIILIMSLFTPLSISQQVNFSQASYNGSSIYGDRNSDRDIAVQSSPSWPDSWTLIDTDPPEDGPNDDYRDVHYAYYASDGSYLYLRLECYGIPSFSSNGDARFKWFIDLDCNAELQGGNIREGEYLFFVEDTDDDSSGEIYLLEDMDNDGMFSEWEQPPDYYSGGLVTDINIVDYRIIGNNIDLYLNLTNIGYPYETCLIWATDQENPNLEQGPTTDRPDDWDIPIGPVQIINPSVEIIKEAGTHLVHIGDTITYTYTVTNAGDVTLTGVTVVDDMLGSVSLNATVLAPDEWAVGTSTYVVTASDLPGPIVNTATASGTDPVGSSVSDSDSEYVAIDYNPDIDLGKQADVNSVNIGDTITYTYTVTNAGDVTLTGVTVVDDMLGSVSLNATVLAPDEWAVGTFTYTVSEGDLPGPIVNTATASGTPPVGDDVTDSDYQIVTIMYSPGISLDKTTNIYSAGIGDTITYTYTVTNAGDVTLTGVTVVDDMLGSVSLNATVLAPDEWAVGTSTYVVTASDLPGPIVNTATASGTDPVGSSVSDSDSESVSVIINPAVEIDKEADVSSANVGDTITYTYTVMNTGDVTLTGVTVVDDVLGTVSLGTTTLAPGQSTAGTKMYTVSEGDLPGPIVNTATASGTDPVGGSVSDSDSESVSITYTACIELDKNADVDTAVIGQTITYTYTVTNCGDVTLTGVTVVDDVLGTVSLGTTTLAPGQSTAGTKMYTVSEGDLPGPIVNTATASGTDPVGGSVSDSDSESVSITYTACIELDKNADVDTAVIGQTITYTYTVTNCGDVTLTGVTVVDDVLGTVSLGTTTLAPGQSTAGTKMYTVSEGDLPGPIVNTATASGTDPVGGSVSDSDSESVSITYTACIELDKNADVDTAVIGQTITYTYTVTNCGDVTLTGVTVVDDVLGTVSLGTTTLAPGQSTAGTKTYTVSEGDLPGPIVNTATASGTDPVGGSVSDSDSESVSITYTACIELDKNADVDTAVIGQTITYTYTVTNCGDVTLTGVTVVDDVLGTVSLGTTTLAPGQSTAGTKTYTVSEGDLPGPIVNTATASGTDPVGGSVSDSDSESVSITYTACIELDKNADVDTAVIGQTITYTYTVTNCGDVTLTGVTVVDDVLGTVSLGTTTLAPGQSTAGTKTYTVSEGDLPGPIVNTATASGTDPVGGSVSDSDSESVSITYTACIELDKNADVDTAVIGQTITYTYTVTNCGDVTLTGVTVVDDVLGTVSLGTTTLAPGQSTAGTKMYTVSEGDLPGPIVNTATASGTDPVGGSVSDSDSESVSIEIVPSIELDKEADVSSANVGDTITYTYTVMNTGDVTLTGVTVVDDVLGTVSLGTATLAPGQSTTGTLSLTVDCDHLGYIVNTATATGTDPVGGVATDSDSESVYIYINPEIEVEKKVLNEETGQWEDSIIAFVENDITFRITVSNTGDVPLNNVDVIDDLPSFLTYNYDADPSAYYESENQVKWSLGTLDTNEFIDIYFSAYVNSDGSGFNNVHASGSLCIEVSDEDDILIQAIPCAEEVWIDDSWHSQNDVDQYNSSLLWGINAFNIIQKGVDVLCNCGIVHVLNGTYYEQILINKDLSLFGEEGAEIILPNIVNSYTIEGSTESWIPIILAYGGILIGNDISGPGNIATMVDNFEFNGRNYTDSVAILYHNVESGCVPSIISNNTIMKIYSGIKIDGCSQDTTIIHNRIRWAKYTTGKIGIIITESGECEPNSVEIHYNYLGIPCGLNIGVWNQVSIIVNATFNWWGEDDGPSSPRSGNTYDAITGRIADGFGDQVVGLIYFDPWWGVEASGIVSPTNALTGEIIHFDASDSFAYDVDGAIEEENIQYMWNFDDGYYSFSKHIGHIYDSPGKYDVVLRIRVIDYNLEEVYGFLFDFAYFTIYISEPDSPLMANADAGDLGGYKGTINLPMHFYGSATGGVPPYSFLWDFGSGDTSTEQNPTHTYTITGNYMAILTVSDSEGKSASDTAVVAMNLDELIASAGGPYSGFVGETIPFKGSAIGGLEPYIFIWDFSDGGQPVQEQNPVHAYEQENTYIAILRVIDSQGNIDDNEAEVRITEDPDNQVLIKNIRGGLGVKATIVTGTVPVNWSIDIDGFIPIGGKASGTVPANSIETVKLPFSFGFGRIHIAVTAGGISKECEALMLGPFVFSVKET